MATNIDITFPLDFKPLVEMQVIGSTNTDGVQVNVNSEDGWEAHVEIEARFVNKDRTRRQVICKVFKCRGLEDQQLGFHVLADFELREDQWASTSSTQEGAPESKPKSD